jgi:hypothetical protein
MADPPPIRFNGRGRPGRVGEAVRDTVGEQRDVWAALAISTADLVDAARISADPKLFLAASRELRGILPLIGGGGGRDRGDGAGEQPGADDDLADELGAGPEMGDPS